MATDSRTDVIIVPSGTLPLFIDAGIDTDVNEVVFGLFASPIVPFAYSAFPVLVRHLARPNDYFALTVDPPDDSVGDFWASLVPKGQDGSGVKKAKLCDFLHSAPPATSRTIHLLTRGDNVAVIISEILNPFGIGAFCPMTDDSAHFTINPKYHPFPHPALHAPAPNTPLLPVTYSMSMLKDMLFEPGADFSPVDLANLICLKYPLPQYLFPRPDMGKLRDRYVFFFMMLRNPPPFRFDDRHRIATKEVREGQEWTEIVSVRPFEWVFVYCGGRDGGIVSISQGHRPLGQGLMPILDPNFDHTTEPFAVRATLVNHTAALMHPKEGSLFVEGVQDCWVDVYSFR
jgi:hypothetical protein